MKNTELRLSTTLILVIAFVFDGSAIDVGYD